ncbi:MAG: hypothetical protein CMF59_19025 [Leptospiraceae bacterium]|nr:hypothetical protein [Leptospiraceae bacterium]
MKTGNSSITQSESTEPPKRKLWQGVKATFAKAKTFVNNNGLISSFLATALWAFITLFFGAFGTVFEETVRESYEWQFGLIVCAFASFIVIVISVYYILAAMDRKSIRLDLGAALRRLESHNELGLVSIWGNESAEHIDQNYQEMREIIETVADRKLDLLFTTGYEAMSMDAEHETVPFKNLFSERNDGNPRKAVLHDLVQGLRGPVRVLLLNPLSKTAQDRGREVITDGPMYQQLIYRTVAFLELAKSKNRSLYLEFGFYSQKPVWNVVKNDTVTFVQPVSPQRTARLNTWLCFANNNFGITEGFNTLFEKKWEERTLEKLDSPEFRENVDRIKSEIEAKMK